MYDFIYIYLKYCINGINKKHIIYTPFLVGVGLALFFSETITVLRDFSVDSDRATSSLVSSIRRSYTDQ